MSIKSKFRAASVTLAPVGGVGPAVLGVTAAAATAAAATPSCGSSCAGADAAEFPDTAAFEIKYAPFGGDSALCIGVTEVTYGGEGRMLLLCGVSANTAWIASTHDSPTTSFNGYAALFNGTAVNPGIGYLTDATQPRAQVGDGYAALFNGTAVNPGIGYLTDATQPRAQVGDIAGNQALQPGRIA